MEVEVNFSEDDYGEEKSLLASFSLHFDEEKFCEFTIFEPEMFKKQEYLNFCEKKSSSMEFCNSNGYVAMSWTLDNKIKCQVSKHGAGGDGEIICYFPGNLMIPKIRELAGKLD